MSSKKLFAKYLSEQEYPQWNKFVASSGSGSIYSTPEYLDILCSVTGGRFEILAVYKGDEIYAGIGVYRESSICGEHISTRLLLYYNGIVLRDFATSYPSEQTSRHLAASTILSSELASKGLPHLLLHCRGLTDTRVFGSTGWSVRPTYSYVMPLRDITESWQRVEQNLKRLVRRAEDNGLQFTSDDDFDSFYKLHSEIHERKGSALYLPRELYSKYISSLLRNNLARIYSARLANGRAVASQLTLLGDHPVTHTVCAGASADYLNLGSTPFLRWKAFENLAELGYQANDLTDAALNSVTRFKGQLGADLTTGYVLKRPDSLRWKSADLVKRIVLKGFGVVRTVLRGNH